MNSTNVPIGEVAEVFNGKTPSKKDKRSSGHPVLKVKDVGLDRRFSGVFDNFVDADFALKYPSKWINENDTLILNSAHNASHVGSKLYLAEKEVERSLPVGEWTILRPNRDRIEPALIYWWLNSDVGRSALKGAVTGLHLYPKDVAELPIPLPPLEEQRRIVEILNRATKTERLRAQAADRLREFIPALFVKMFGQTNPGADNWPTYSVAEILQGGRRSIRTGPFGSQLKHSEFTDEGVPVLGIDNVVTNRFVWTKPRHVTPAKYSSFLRYRVFPGDVIVTIMGTTGRVCVTPDDLPECMSTKHLCVLTLDRSRIEPLFLWGALLFDENVRAQTRRQGQGQIMEGWNLTIVKGLQVRIPPLHAQRSFARVVAQILDMEKRTAAAIDFSSTLSGSLMNRFLDAAA